MATVDGRETSDLRIANRRVVPHFDGAPAPEGATIDWSLHGDVLADFALGRFSPLYLIRRKLTQSGAAPSKSRVVDIIWHLHAKRWPLSEMERDGAIVAAWMVNGRPTQVAVIHTLPLVNTLSIPSTLATLGGVSLPLRDDEAGGFPVLLLWDRGRWIRPEAYSHNTEFQAAAAAIYRDDPVAFRSALERIKDLDARPGGADATLLHLAAESGRLFAVEALIEKGARVDRKTDWSKTDLFNDRPEVFRDAPLNWAVRTGRTSVVSCLLKHGAIRGNSAPLFEPLLRQALESGSTEIAKHLLEALPDDRAREKHLAAWLKSTLAWGDVSVLDTWVDSHGSNTFAGVEPAEVLRAAMSHDPGILRLLLRGGASPDSATDQATALQAAASMGRTESIRLLVEAGARIDEPAPDGMTPLQAAVRTGQIESTRLLLSLGANANTARPSEPSALHFAVGLGRADLVALLLDHGARIDTTDQERRTPLDVALLRGVPGPLETLIRRGARLDRQTPNFTPSLNRCLELNALQLIERAVEDGWDPNEPSTERWLPWQIAQLSGARDTAKWLRTRTTAPASHVVYRTRDLDTPPDVVAVSLGRKARLFDPDLLTKGVTIDGVITEGGYLLFASVTRSANVVLTGHVVEAIRSWQFKPGRREGRPVAVRVRIDISFTPDPTRATGPTAAAVAFGDAPSDEEDIDI